jgi:Tannase and feruloyl esterase
MRIVLSFIASCSFGLAATVATAQAAGDKCGTLASLELPKASVTSAKTVAAGAFSGPAQNFAGVDLTSFYSKLPAFCRVSIDAKPTSDSDIKVEVWLPLDGWNGRLQGTGNGGFAGMIDYFELGAGVSRGYAVTATDTGHTGSPIEAAWALGHPEKVADFGHRGIHEMTTLAKLVVQKFYGGAPKHSYFAGCSDGGREALMEAQRYPDDYDGILAGAPANYWTALLSLGGVVTQALAATPDSFIPQAKIPAIAQAVIAQCDKQDGVADGILNDPRQCRFDPAAIACKAGENSDKCLTPAQVTALKTIYSGVKDSHGTAIFPGYLPGAEEGGGGWGVWITGPAAGKGLMAFFASGYFSDMVYEKKDWSVQSFAVDADMKAATEKTADALNAVNADLTAFRSHGGKLILYHGWNDPAIPALNTVNYYEQVMAKAGQANTDAFVRLYMVPGMQHCFGGLGADSIGQFGTWTADAAKNARTALENWVERGTAPGTIIATKISGQGPLATGDVVMTRPLCPYPQAAQYKGSGDAKNAENFTCASPKK